MSKKMSSNTDSKRQLIFSTGKMRKTREGLHKLFKQHSFEEENVKGKIVVVTGASRGIGKEVARELAQRDAIVVMACISLEEALTAIVDIRRKSSLGTLIPMQINLASLDSVRDFAAVCTQRLAKIDILINNAGIMMPDDSKVRTEDGFEPNFGVNYLGHFLLTNLLLDLLSKSDAARVVTVSSLTLKYGKLDFSNPLNWEITGKRPYYPQTYSNSKLALALFSRELAQRTRGSNLKTYCLCPGITATGISNFITSDFTKMFMFLGPFVFQTPAQASRSILYCAVGKECSQQSGQLYRRCKLWGDTVYPDEILVPGPMPEFKDGDCKALWEMTLKLVELTLKHKSCKD